MLFRSLKHIYELISLMTGKIPLQILVNAISIPSDALDEMKSRSLFEPSILINRKESESINRLGTNIRSGTIDSQIGRPNSSNRPKMAAPIFDQARQSQMVSPTCSWAPDRGRDFSDGTTEQVPNRMSNLIAKLIAYIRTRISNLMVRKDAHYYLGQSTC